MKPLHYIILALFLLYLLGGIIFMYMSLTYRKDFTRIRRSANILLSDLNEELSLIKNAMEEDGVELRFTPFAFEKENDDFIDQHRDEVYAAIDKALEKARKYFIELTDQEKIDAIANKIANLDNNMTNYRRLVLKHNKIVDNYNFNSQTIFFILFAQIIGLKRENHI